MKPPCTFCGKALREVTVMIEVTHGGGGPTICDECIEQCMQLLLRHLRQSKAVSK